MKPPCWQRLLATSRLLKPATHWIAAGVVAGVAAAGIPRYAETTDLPKVPRMVPTVPAQSIFFPFLASELIASVDKPADVSVFVAVALSASEASLLVIVCKADVNCAEDCEAPLRRTASKFIVASV